MRYPYTGLYSFCTELGKALLRQKINDDLAFYVPKNLQGVFGPNENYLIHHKSDKFFPLKLSKCKIWHSTYQNSNYLPYKRKGLRIVATIHDLNFLHQNKPAFKQKKYLAKTQNLINKADSIVAISQFVKKEIEQHLNTKGKPVHVIYNGRNKPDAVEFKQPAGDFNKPFFFTIGTITHKKNFHVLPALLLKNDHNLIIAGITQNENYRQKIINEAARLGVADRVKLIGPVLETEKYWLLKNCTAFCFPSLAEGFGLPVIEAMQLGTPAIISKETSLPEIGGPHALFFNDFTSESVSKTAEVFLNTEITNKKKEELINWSEQFDWDMSAKAYWDIYTSLL